MDDAAPAVGSSPGGSSVIASVMLSLRLWASAGQGISRGRPAAAELASRERRLNMNRAPEILADGSRAAVCGLQQCFYTTAHGCVALGAWSARAAVSFQARCCRAMRGTARTRACVYGCCGAWNSCCGAPRSTMRPSLSTMASSHRCWTTARSWLMNRSEEHTSELQSQSNLVCRLLLEKKKKKK